jgi:hypothetical protein
VKVAVALSPILTFWAVGVIDWFLRRTLWLPLPFKPGVFVLAIALTTMSFAIHAQAQNSTKEAPGPTSTAEKKAYDDAFHSCVQQYNQQEIPRSQFHSFTRRCLGAKGYTKPVMMPDASPKKLPQPASK